MTTSATTSATFGPRSFLRSFAVWGRPRPVRRSISTVEYFNVAGARIDYGDWDPPQVFFGGASPAAEEVAAQHVDTYLAWGETPTQIAERLDRIRARAAAHGRTLQFGIRLHVISRDTSAEAWAHAERLLASISDERIASAQKVLARTESVGQQRMTALHDGRTSDLTGGEGWFALCRELAPGGQHGLQLVGRMPSEPAFGGQAEPGKELRRDGCALEGPRGAILGMQETEVDLGAGFKRQAAQRLPVRTFGPGRDRRRLNRVDATLYVAGQAVGEGDDRRGVTGQDVSTTACGRLIVGRVTHER